MFTHTHTHTHTHARARARHIPSPRISLGAPEFEPAYVCYLYILANSSPYTIVSFEIYATYFF